MYCGIAEDELELLEAASTAAVTKCESGQPCTSNTCHETDSKKGTSGFNSTQSCGVSQGSWARENAHTLACMKCKVARAVVLVRQREPLCQACLEAGVAGKVRSIKSSKLLLPQDHIVVAFSGGFASQTLLCNVLPMRKDMGTSRKERGKIDFKLEAVHVDEAAACGIGAEDAALNGVAVEAAVRHCCSSSTPPGSAPVPVHVVPLSDVFLWLDDDWAERRRQLPVGQSGWQQPQPSAQRLCTLVGQPPPQQLQRQQDQRPKQQPLESGNPTVVDHTEAGGALPTAVRSFGGDGDEAEEGEKEAANRTARDALLRALLQSVPDPTGREDLLQYLREQLLAAVAKRLGASKVLRGDTASVLAARVISDTAKGRGYALPGDIQLLDARGWRVGEPAVLQPMREVTLKEVVFFCRLRGLKPVQLLLSPPEGPRRSINWLASSFVHALQTNLPSTIFTILSTANALKPFPFNSLEALKPRAAANANAITSDGRGCGGGSSSAPHWKVAMAHAEYQNDGSEGGCTVVSWRCALCRAPLTRRELEGIAARQSLRAQRQVGVNDAAAGHCHGGVDGASAVTGDEAVAVDNAKAASWAADVQKRVVDGDDDDVADDLGAPFCTSCRSQILCTPEQSAGTRNSAVMAGSLPSDHLGELKWTVLGLLPACLR